MDLKNKPKLTIQNQIIFLADKNIKFKIKTREEAERFLANNSYLFKIKAYAKNYSKNPDGTYIDLDFAYLVDLSIIDMHLRKSIIKICLDTEHLLKTKLLRDFDADQCDGYEIVDDFLNKNLNLKKSLKKSAKISKNNQNLYTAKDIILRKYGANLSIWNFIEIIEFGNFINFCEFYYQTFKNQKYNEIKSMLWSLKCLRNLSAHNNCIINNLNVFSDFYPNIGIKNQIKSLAKLSDRTTNKKLKNPFIYDFIVLILLFDNLCKSKNIKFQIYKELITLFRKRMRKNMDYYKNNTLLTSSYIFVVKFLMIMVKNRHKI